VCTDCVQTVYLTAMFVDCLTQTMCIDSIADKYQHMDFFTFNTVLV